MEKTVRSIQTKMTERKPIGESSCGEILNAYNRNEITAEQRVRSDILFTSDFYHIKGWTFNYSGEKIRSKEVNDCFCFAIVQKGFFFFDMFRDSYEMHTGHILIDKPNYEYSMRLTPGACSIFNFTDSFYHEFVQDNKLENTSFFANNNILSLVLKSTPEIDYLHHKVLQGVHAIGKLEMDYLVLEILRQIVEGVTVKSLNEDISASLKRNHLTTIEKAKEYLNENFLNDISLLQLARHCCVSLSHFSRIFKKFTSYSPHQYLLNIRLKHAELLLKSSAKPIIDIGFSSGFNSVEHFATSFKQRYKMNPTNYRKALHLFS